MIGKASNFWITKQIRSWQFWVVMLLASQYALFQLIWPVEYQDGPRNLHWGILLTEEPRFLLDVEDPYDRTYGFPPQDPGLAPAGLARDQGTWFHGWWGPLYPICLALLWKLTNSYTLLQLFSPLFAGLLVMMTYLFGARYFNRRSGFTAALILSIFPVFREHAVLAYTEPVAAMLIFAALWSHLERRTGFTILFGSLAVLVKIDMILLYFGSLILSEWLSWGRQKALYNFRHAILSISVPGVVVSLWLILNYGITGRHVTVLGSPGIDNLIELAPMLIDQFFTTVPLLTYFTLILMILCIAISLMKQEMGGREVYNLLGIWSGLGILVLVVYMVFPGATNNPRVLIPAFPALCLLIAAGLNHLAVRPRMVAESYLVVILFLMSAIGGLYQMILSDEHVSTLPVWEALRDEPEGYVMTEYFWQANLYARQPATWFFGDAVYEHNILHELENFQPYIEQHPIRYVVLPVDDDPARQYDSRCVQIYQTLGIGRMLELRSEPITGPEVRAYLERTYPYRAIGPYVLFTLW